MCISDHKPVFCDFEICMFKDCDIKVKKFTEPVSNRHIDNSKVCYIY